MIQTSQNSASENGKQGKKQSEKSGEGDKRDLEFLSALHKACMGFRKALAASDQGSRTHS